MKKVLSLFLFIICMLSLSACAQLTGEGGGDPSTDPSADSSPSTSPSGVVTDFHSSTPTVHEVIVPLDIEDGEELTNPYYKRTVDEDGVAVYVVKKAGNGQPAHLPIEQTVLYSGTYEECFYESCVLSYTLDGEEVEVVQYQLHVNAEAPEITVKTYEAAGQPDPSES